MFGLFNSKNEKGKKTDEDIVILSKPGPMTCGGKDAYIDKRLPGQITSNEMFLFDVSSDFSTVADSGNDSFHPEYINAFASGTDNGVFIFYEKRGYYEEEEGVRKWALIEDDNVFSSLVKLVTDSKLADNNGYHSTTHGLPKNFGGTIDVRYKSGERISISNNQSPVLSLKTGKEIDDLFMGFLDKEQVKLPGVDDLKEIHFSDEIKDGSFTRAVLTINSDGTGIDSKSSRYDDEKIYESTKQVDASTIEAIKKTMESCGIPAWNGLAKNDFDLGLGDKTMTFVYEGGKEISVSNNLILPQSISNGFFNIELEITTKN